jgi:hypothetical protein
MDALINPVIQTGPASRSDGDFSAMRGGNYGEGSVAQFWGKYTELVRRGVVFSAPVAAAAAVPIATTATNAPSLWNPSDSGKIVIPLEILLSLGAVGTPILQGFVLQYLTLVGNLVATGLPVATWTNVAPTNLLLGKGLVSTTKFSPAVSTYTVNPARLMDLGFGHLLEGAAASGQLYSKFSHEFDGKLIMPPGTSIHFCSTIATSTTYWTTIIFAELPLPAGGL